jgi:hypothetical protein
MRKQSKPKNLIVKFPVFSGFVVHVDRTDDMDEAISNHPIIADMTGGNDTADAVTIYDGDMECYIFILPNADPGTIAHEAWHAIRHMMLKVGVELDNEAVAYHLGYLVNRIHGVDL